MNAAPLPRSFRLSLRELLLLCAAVAAGCAALKYANDWWLTAVGAVTLVAFMAATIVALVDRGPRQACAIGFVACIAIYASLLTLGNELSPWSGRLPTTRLLRPVYVTLRQQVYQNSKTGAQVLRSQLPAGAQVDDEGAFREDPFGTKVQTLARTGVLFRSRGYAPPSEQFMPIGHCLWALALGYVGGHFGRFIYARRTVNDR